MTLRYYTRSKSVGNPMSHHINRYYDPEDVAAVVIAEGRHRDFVGGLWDEIGQLQLDFARRGGLQPHMRVLDIGCGCLRGGVRFVAYLDAGHYYGIDVCQELIDAGYEQELGALGLKEKLPRTNLACNGEFSAEPFGVQFDVAMAQSVFTHLPMNYLRLCLARIAPVVRPGGVFYATIFLSPPEHDWCEPRVQVPELVASYPDRDPYHYRVEDLAHCAAGLPWSWELVGDWGHPRNQLMVTFTRAS